METISIATLEKWFNLMKSNMVTAMTSMPDSFAERMHFEKMAHNAILLHKQGIRRNPTLNVYADINEKRRAASWLSK